jgi:hypothetical protein
MLLRVFVSVPRLLGTPSLQDFPGMDQLPEYSPDMPPYPPPKGGLASLVKRLPKDGIDLLSQMLRYAFPPRKRSSIPFLTICREEVNMQM